MGCTCDGKRVTPFVEKGATKFVAAVHPMAADRISARNEPS
ncbi:unnamed protein product [Acidocella sp. C78]|nr:unnamed protein product [Acidocella sp. C78]